MSVKVSCGDKDYLKAIFASLAFDEVKNAYNAKLVELKDENVNYLYKNQRIDLLISVDCFLNVKRVTY